jgi:periplasmic mercuric ion binding protein
MAFAAHAESKVTLTDVHNCCKSCANGITKAVTSVPGATATIDKSTITITAKSDADATKATAALLKAGYYGSGATAGTASEGKVKSATVTGVHLCCGKCVDAFNKAAKSGGATTTDATKGAASVKVEGDFSPKDLLAALNKGGFNGDVK